MFRKRKPGRWMIWLIACIGISALAVSFLVPWSVRTSGKSPIISNIKQCSLAILMYAADSDDLLPPARTWMAGVSAYMLDNDSFWTEQPGSGAQPHSLEVPPPGDDPTLWKPGRFGMVFNIHVDRLLIQGVASPTMPASADPIKIGHQSCAITPLVFESRDRGWNAVGDPREVSEGMLKAGRKGKHVGYVDGHAKWCPIERVPDLAVDPMLSEVGGQTKAKQAAGMTP